MHNKRAHPSRLFASSVKLESTSLMIVSATRVAQMIMSTAVLITSEVLSSFRSYENRFFIEYSISTIFQYARLLLYQNIYFVWHETNFIHPQKLVSSTHVADVFIMSRSGIIKNLQKSVIKQDSLNPSLHSVYLSVLPYSKSLPPSRIMIMHSKNSVTWYRARLFMNGLNRTSNDIVNRSRYG